MRMILIFLVTGLLFSGCENTNKSNYTDNLEIANKFIDAFYSFDNDSLQEVLSRTDDSKQSILYYQGWAKCGNYVIIERHQFIVTNDSVIKCPITVKDDLIGTLKIDFHTTDTFHLTIIDGKIRSIQSSSNDPEKYFQAKEWVKQNLPELIEVPCQGIWEDGTSPCDCVQAMVKGFAEFVKNSGNN
ncbi:hypothetical protein OU798_08800 [Prolixibacteraceae bacterium Z1-6]|uniref:Uncharacterized protein n=1 Tax=Draconibacterium aestuarii TaxID=2998507 RepID=A0A9X3J6F8_9BACT|nr:hypothetical protein [Prolixibacteraceae bacterium Z1-6]